MKGYTYEMFASVGGLILGVLLMCPVIDKVNGTLTATMSAMIISGFCDFLYSQVTGKEVSLRRLFAGFVPACIGIAIVNLFS